MAREQFIDRAFKPASLTLIEQANVIIDGYLAAGFKLTLRQLYYQFVARGLLANKQENYKRLGSIVNDGRLAGLIDWEAIEDRTRNIEKRPAWESPEEIVGAVARQYRENPWLSQDRYVEVWIEKEALVGVIEPVCKRYRVPYLACRGYVSQSETYAAGERMQRAIADGKEPLVLHLGDHDPSGIDMTRDNAARLLMLSHGTVEVIRLALNRDQIDQYDPPPNPAKDTDARFAGYRDEHGDESWELDALDPPVIDALISTALDDVIDRERWDEAMASEQTNRELMQLVSDRWDEVADYLKELDQ